MRNSILAYLNDESGATAIEYGLIAVFMGTVIIVAVSTVGSKLKITFTDVGGNLAQS